MSTDDATAPRITVERLGAVLTIGLDRPAKRNAADVRMLQELALAYGEYARDDSLRAAVVHGVGDHFTGGLDLAAIAPPPAQGAPDPVPRGGPGPPQLHRP